MLLSFVAMFHNGALTLDETMRKRKRLVKSGYLLFGATFLCHHAFTNSRTICSTNSHSKSLSSANRHNKKISLNCFTRIGGQKKVSYEISYAFVVHNFYEITMAFTFLNFTHRSFIYGGLSVVELLLLDFFFPVALMLQKTWIQRMFSSLFSQQRFFVQIFFFSLCCQCSFFVLIFLDMHQGWSE